jgi:cytochrome c
VRPWTAALVTVTAIVGMGYVHPFGNPRAEPPKGLGAVLQSANMPEETKTVLVEKCADCHSSETRWPIYARIAPGSWLIERDIVEARKKMDLSRWEEMPTEKQEVLMAEIVQAAKSGHMPPPQYLLLHRNATLSKTDVRALSMLSNVTDESEATAAGDGDVARGKAVFEMRCTGCHAMNADREGPRLAGVYGRKAASVPGFAYSKGLRNSGLTWSDTTLERWLSDPDTMIPDNNMSFSVPKATERKDLIAYLKH